MPTKTNDSRLSTAMNLVGIVAINSAFFTEAIADARREIRNTSARLSAEDSDQLNALSELFRAEQHIATLERAFKGAISSMLSARAALMPKDGETSFPDLSSGD